MGNPKSNPKLQLTSPFAEIWIAQIRPFLASCSLLTLGLSELQSSCFLGFFWSTGALGLSVGINNHDHEGNTRTTIFMLRKDRAFLLSSDLLQMYGSMKTVLLGQIKVRHYARPCSV